MFRTHKTLNFLTSQEAWEGLNELFIYNEESIVKRNGTRSGNQLIAYDTFVNISKLWMDPALDFNKLFNYKKNKWVTLVNNYVDRNYLDIVKLDVKTREAKKDNTYNVSYQFSNQHNHGKGCLLSITFTRRPYFPDPLLIVHLRSSEIVKRLGLDFLLVQRIAEYVYGDGVNAGAKFYFPNMYTMSEVSPLYGIHKPIVYGDGKGPFFAKIMKSLMVLQTSDPETMKFHMFARSARAVQGKVTGGPLLAGNLRF
jgi:hypothetical protein